MTAIWTSIRQTCLCLNRCRTEVRGRTPILGSAGRPAPVLRDQECAAPADCDRNDSFEGRSRKYTADFELTLASGAVLLIEVKPEERALAPDEEWRLRRIGEHFSELACCFEF
ncbi:hypothetical protein PI86_01930 [Burkholderia sp. A9]|nr:hypothetical protein PI86_01930 [Burkholderia sp. A9]